MATDRSERPNLPARFDTDLADLPPLPTYRLPCEDRVAALEEALDRLLALQETPGGWAEETAAWDHARRIRGGGRS